MKSTQIKIIAVLSCFSSICFLGCKKFLQIAPPETQLVTTSVFNDNAAATAALTGIYTQMENNSESSNMAVNLGLLSDELTNYYGTNTTNYQFYTNAMQATNSGLIDPWTNVYNYIYQANGIIAGVQGNASLSPAVAKQLLGEAKFTRAFWFFYLTNLYGDIPLTTSTAYTLNATISRTSKALVYQQIVSDLKDAKSLMNPNYIDASDTAITTSARTRPNKWAAGALLARVYLYTNDKTDAESEADSIINATLYSLCPDLNNVFLVNSSEAIWQWDIVQPSYFNTPDARAFIMTSAPGTGPCCSIAPQLLNSFEPGDNRRLNWVDSFPLNAPPNQAYYYPYKYKVLFVSNVTEDVMVFRLAEQYLIRAEARALQNNLSGAASDLNIIRNRAGLGNIADSIASSQPAMLTAILHERQVELFTEWGHRWLDLIRTNSADSVMSIVTPQKGGIWSRDDNQLLFPLPQNELEFDPKLTQNPGY